MGLVSLQEGLQKDLPISSGNKELFYSEMVPDPESTDTFILDLPLSSMIRGDFRTNQ